MITTTSLMIVFIIIMLGLISQQQLVPGVVVLGSFILFVLWLAGLIETSIQLYGPSGAVNSYCGSRPNTDSIDSQQTAVWLANSSLCEYHLSPLSISLSPSFFYVFVRRRRGHSPVTSQIVFPR